MPFVPDQQQTPGRFVPDAPPGAQGPRLGPTASGLVRGPVEGLVGAATAIPDMATMIGNTAGNWIDKAGQKLFGMKPGFMGPDVQSPGEAAQGVIDKYTMAPTSRTGKLEEAINSALYGSLAGPKVPKPNNVSPVVRRLANEGVTMTPGQRMGGLANKAEEKAGAIFPSIKNARGRAVEDWNRARINDSLRDAGGKEVPKGVTGQEAVKHAEGEMRTRYQKVLGKMRMDGHAAPGPNPGKLTVQGQPQPGSFLDKVARLKAVGQNLDPKERTHLNEILDREVTGRFSPGGKATGETIQRIGEALDKEIRSFGNNPDYNQRKLIKAFEQVKVYLNETLERQNPKVAPEYKKLQQGYAKFKTSVRSAVKSPTAEGRYTPGQRLSSIKGRDKSVDKIKFATGRAPGQQEAQEAHRVLGNTLADSGTPMGMALLEVGKLAKSPALAVGLGGLPAMYSRPVLQALQQAALKDPRVSRLLGIYGGAQQSSIDLGPYDQSS